MISEINEIGVEEQRSEDECFQSFFVEHMEVLELINSLETSLDSAQQVHNQLNKILSKYQEQCQLLDPHLTQMVASVMRIAKKVIGLGEDKIVFSNLDQEKKLRHSVFQIIYLLTKVRGFKVVTKLFPHDISDLEPLFKAYKNINTTEWETKYIILLWLSIIVINPFDLIIVDPTNQLPNDMIMAAKSQLAEPGKPRDAAAVFLSKLLTRPDMVKEHLHDFMKWAIETINQDSTSTFLKAGILRTIVTIFKIGKREELLHVIPIIYDFAVNEKEVSNSMLKHLSIKLIQRLGLTFLKPRVVSWRYHTTRLTLSHLKKNQQIKKPKIEEDDEEIEVPEEIEQIITNLLNGLRDKDTIVRWSSAKGIGRITLRLTKQLGDEIVESICELMSPNEDDNSWHGSSLALAELARRGLLLPERLSQVIPLIEKSLIYDVRKGTHSVGAHVRDAACYVCWAFARAYAPDVVKPYMHALAKGLIQIAVYDREVNCRRAAAAAFQENVGRQGNFPHGIDILTKADYFTLCNRNNAYLNVSHYISQFPEYCQGLISFLLETKTTHWDKSIRELTAKTLAKLCERDINFMVDDILPKLIERTLSVDLNTRHGALLALSEIILSLCNNGFNFSEELQTKLRSVVPEIEAKRLYRGKGGEIMRESVCRYIECMSLCHIPLPKTIAVSSSLGNRQLKKKTLSVFQETLDENLKHPNNEIIELAVNALKAFANEYYVNDEEFAKEIVKKHIQSLSKEINPAARRGFALSLGVFPKEFISPFFDEAVDVLISKLELEEDKELQDAEARRNAVYGIISLCENVGKDGISENNADKIFKALVKATNDYGVDKRGDVGSWVREAAVLSLERWCKLLNGTPELQSLFTVEMGAALMSALLRQANEKIDKVRDTTGKTIYNILNNSTTQNIPFKSELLKLIEEYQESDDGIIDWSSPEKTYQLFVNCIGMDIYRCSTLNGFILSMGGMSSHVFKSSTNALVDYLKSHTEVLEKVAQDILQISVEFALDDRVILPLLKSFSQLLSYGIFESIQPPSSDFSEKILINITKEITNCNNVQKIMLAVDVFCELIKFNNPTREKTFQRLFTSCLSSRFPKVREYTGNQLYGALQVIGDIMFTDEILDKVLEILCSTTWTEPATTLKTAVDNLYDITSIPKPVMKKVTQPQQ
ncbi:hypothetical protein ABK040_004751 [Willaertia magna]